MITLSQILQNSRQVLGRNERQLQYIRRNNLRRSIQIADNKLKSKRILKENNIPVPETIAVIRNRQQLIKFDFNSLPKSFVIKPIKGVRGNGVEIFYNRDKAGKWIRSDRSKASIGDLKAFCEDIIDGRYSLFNEPDGVLIEERIRPHKNFKYYSYKGTPDIRIIIYNKIPIMGMLRLPTQESNGKANLDLGAIGTGIDIAIGKTTTAISGKSRKIEYIPKYNLPLSGVKIPYWDKILRYSIEASSVTKLGFAAIDFLIDKEKGPVIVELNARPGLSIQLANQDGLRWRLRKARGLKVKTTFQGIRLAKDLFGGEIEEEIEEISGKQVIGLIQPVNLFGKDNQTKISVKSKIDTGASLSSMDIDLARKLGFTEAIDFAENILKDAPKRFENIEEAKKYSEENNLNQRLEQHPDIFGTAIIKAGNGIAYRISINIKIEISGTILDTHMTLTNRSNLSFPLIIGEKDLKQFLIDPGKK